MGLLDKLWDDTLAGPCPDTGLGKLRKITVTDSASAPEEYKEALRRLKERRANVEFQRSNDEAIQVTHSITIIKPPGYLRSLSMDSTSFSAGSSPPFSPYMEPGSAFNQFLQLTPREQENPWRSNKYINFPAAAKKECEKSPRAELRRPTVYDWVVFSALDG